jgi:hypothetical protein
MLLFVCVRGYSGTSYRFLCDLRVSSSAGGDIFFSSRRLLLICSCPCLFVCVRGYSGPSAFWSTAGSEFICPNHSPVPYDFRFCVSNLLMLCEIKADQPMALAPQAGFTKEGTLFRQRPSIKFSHLEYCRIYKLSRGLRFTNLEPAPCHKYLS